MAEPEFIPLDDCAEIPVGAPGNPALTEAVEHAMRILAPYERENLLQWMAGRKWCAGEPNFLTGASIAKRKLRDCPSVMRELARFVRKCPSRWRV